MAGFSGCRAGLTSGPAIGGRITLARRNGAVGSVSGAGITPFGGSGGHNGHRFSKPVLSGRNDRFEGLGVVVAHGADGAEPWGNRETRLVLAGAPLLEYQPIVDLGRGQLLGLEALLRWQHPTEGLILPGLLIPWAEANGDILALGEWVLSEGCRHAMSWPRSVQLAVNISIVQLRRGEASRAVEQALNETGLAPDRLTVEVTEHAMSDESAVADLRRIAAMGVELAVDDVGTSWNSFDLLRRMDIDTVKIDASFVGSLEAHEGINRMIVETVVHLAHSSGMTAVAEGVETAQHSKIVREFDCDAAQGYFFARPLEVDIACELARLPDHRFPFEGGGWVVTDEDDQDAVPA